MTKNKGRAKYIRREDTGNFTEKDALNNPKPGKEPGQGKSTRK